MTRPLSHADVAEVHRLALNCLTADRAVDRRSAAAALDRAVPPEAVLALTDALLNLADALGVSDGLNLDVFDGGEQTDRTRPPTVALILATGDRLQRSGSMSFTLPVNHQIDLALCYGEGEVGEVQWRSSDPEVLEIVGADDPTHATGVAHERGMVTVAVVAKVDGDGEPVEVSGTLHVDVVPPEMHEVTIVPGAPEATLPPPPAEGFRIDPPSPVLYDGEEIELIEPGDEDDEPDDDEDDEPAGENPGPVHYDENVARA